MIQITAKLRYFFVLHGEMPIQQICCAYRSTRKNITKLGCRKAIKCPCCNSRLMDIDEKVKVDLYRQPVKSNLQCQGYIKCNKCKDEVGMIMFA